MAATTLLDLSGKSIDDVYLTVVKTGVSQSEAVSFIGNWLLANAGRTQRTFDFHTAFVSPDPDCVFGFARGFAHTDWIDGQSVVQAERTTVEEGFNTRFHAIEKDTDNLAKSVAKLYECVAAMRADLRAMLDEIRTEINRIDADLFRLAQPATPAGGIRFNEPGATKFTGVTRYFDKDYQVFETPQGPLLIPLINAVQTNVTRDPRLTGPASLAKFSETAAVQQAFAGKPVTKADLVKQFGDTIVEAGRSVKELVDILPAGASYPTLDALVSDVTERQAAALRTTPGAADAATATLGTPAGQGVGATPLTRVDTIPAAVATALAKHNIDTVDKLAATDKATLDKILKTEGVTSAGEALGALTVARTLKLLGPQ